MRVVVPRVLEPYAQTTGRNTPPGRLVLDVPFFPALLLYAGFTDHQIRP